MYKKDHKSLLQNNSSSPTRYQIAHF